MTRVRFSGWDGGYLFRCEGHAGAAEKGRDIVCSAVSILSYTLAQSACDLYNEGLLSEEPITNIKDGFVEIQMKPHRDSKDEVRRTIAVIETGFLLLSRTYPDFVSLTTTI
jgi:uncharacterized protein YsxB (DUF464 family)